MNQANTGSLSGLLGGGAAGAGAEPGAGAIPMPGRKWGSRVILPAAVALSMLGLLAYAARDALVQSQQSSLAALVAVYRALGGGWTLPS